MRYLIPLLLFLFSCSSSDNSSLSEPAQHEQPELILGLRLGECYKPQSKLVKTNVHFGLVGMFNTVEYLELNDSITAFIELSSITKSSINESAMKHNPLKKLKDCAEILSKVTVNFANKDLIDTNYYQINHESNAIPWGISKDQYFELIAYSMRSDTDKEKSINKKEGFLDGYNDIDAKLEYECRKEDFKVIVQMFEDKYGKATEWEKTDKSGDYATYYYDDDDKLNLVYRWQISNTEIRLTRHYLSYRNDEDGNKVDIHWGITAEYTFDELTWAIIQEKNNQIYLQKSIDDAMEQSEKEYQKEKKKKNKI